MREKSRAIRNLSLLPDKSANLFAPGFGFEDAFSDEEATKFPDRSNAVGTPQEAHSAEHEMRRSKLSTDAFGSSDLADGSQGLSEAQPIHESAESLSKLSFNMKGEVVNTESTLADNSYSFDTINKIERYRLDDIINKLLPSVATSQRVLACRMLKEIILKSTLLQSAQKPCDSPCRMHAVDAADAPTVSQNAPLAAGFGFSMRAFEYLVFEKYALHYKLFLLSRSQNVTAHCAAVDALATLLYPIDFRCIWSWLGSISRHICKTQLSLAGDFFYVESWCSAYRRMWMDESVEHLARSLESKTFNLDESLTRLVEMFRVPNIAQDLPVRHNLTLMSPYDVILHLMLGSADSHFSIGASPVRQAGSSNSVNAGTDDSNESPEIWRPEFTDIILRGFRRYQKENKMLTAYLQLCIACCCHSHEITVNCFMHRPEFIESVEGILSYRILQYGRGHSNGDIGKKSCDQGHPEGGNCCANDQLSPNCSSLKSHAKQRGHQQIYESITTSAGHEVDKNAKLSVTTDLVIVTLLKTLLLQTTIEASYWATHKQLHQTILTYTHLLLSEAWIHLTEEVMVTEKSSRLAMLMCEVMNLVAVMHRLNLMNGTFFVSQQLLLEQLDLMAQKCADSIRSESSGGFLQFTSRKKSFEELQEVTTGTIRSTLQPEDLTNSESTEKEEYPNASNAIAGKLSHVVGSKTFQLCCSEYIMSTLRFLTLSVKSEERHLKILHESKHSSSCFVASQTSNAPAVSPCVVAVSYCQELMKSGFFFFPQPCILRSEVEFQQQLPQLQIVTELITLCVAILDSCGLNESRCLVTIADKKAFIQIVTVLVSKLSPIFSCMQLSGETQHQSSSTMSHITAFEQLVLSESRLLSPYIQIPTSIHSGGISCAHVINFRTSYAYLVTLLRNYHLTDNGREHFQGESSSLGMILSHQFPKALVNWETFENVWTTHIKDVTNCIHELIVFLRCKAFCRSQLSLCGAQTCLRCMPVFAAHFAALSTWMTYRNRNHANSDCDFVADQDIQKVFLGLFFTATTRSDLLLSLQLLDSIAPSHPTRTQSLWGPSGKFKLLAESIIFGKRPTLEAWHASCSANCLDGIMHAILLGPFVLCDDHEKDRDQLGRIVDSTLCLDLKKTLTSNGPFQRCFSQSNQICSLFLSSPFMTTFNHMHVITFLGRWVTSLPIKCKASMYTILSSLLKNSSHNNPKRFFVSANDYDTLGFSAMIGHLMGTLCQNLDANTEPLSCILWLLSLPSAPFASKHSIWSNTAVLSILSKSDGPRQFEYDEDPEFDPRIVELQDHFIRALKPSTQLIRTSPIVKSCLSAVAHMRQGH